MKNAYNWREACSVTDILNVCILCISIDLFIVIEVLEILNLSCYGFAFWVRYNCGITAIQGSEMLTLLCYSHRYKRYISFIGVSKILNFAFWVQKFWPCFVTDNLCTIFTGVSEILNPPRLRYIALMLYL
jgi:hypothetical protein